MDENHYYDQVKKEENKLKAYIWWQYSGLMYRIKQDFSPESYKRCVMDFNQVAVPLIVDRTSQCITNINKLTGDRYNVAGANPKAIGLAITYVTNSVAGNLQRWDNFIQTSLVLGVNQNADDIIKGLLDNAQSKIDEAVENSVDKSILSTTLEIAANNPDEFNAFEWVTMGDNKVRPAHRALSGKVFKLDNPPSEGMPGEPYNCRCVAKLTKL